MRCVVLAALCAAVSFVSPTRAEPDRPNFVVIFCDDLGYGDLGCFGNPMIETPQLDRMAANGQKWTQFYVAAPVCTPSRAALMTGRYPIRNGMTSSKRVVLFPNSGGGLPPEEITLAEMLKPAKYRSGCFGKWHLGHLPQFLPTAQGFDTYFGVPYSNDMDRVAGTPHYGALARRDPNYMPESAYWNVPLMRDTEIIERPAQQRTLTKRYTEEAIEFIRENQASPFFVYLAHSMPHIPLFASETFKGTSRRGIYGDVLAEIDWSVGQVLAALRELQLEKKTLVVFASDNGPWLTFETHGGSAGPLRAGKGTTFEGGMRVPTIFHWPGAIEAGSTVNELGSTLDLMATFAKLAGVEPPHDRQLDSVDLSPALLAGKRSPRNDLFYWTRGVLHAARLGPWKLHLKTRESIEYGKVERGEEVLLYQVEHDISEKFDVAERHPEIVALLQDAIEKHLCTIEPVPDNLAK